MLSHDRTNSGAAVRTRRMRFVLCSAIFTLLSLGLIAEPRTSGDQDQLSGAWLLSLPPADPTRWTLQFASDGSITGTNPDGLLVRGSIKGETVAFEVLGRADGVRVQFSGRLENGTIRGQRATLAPGAATASPPREFVATPDRPSRTPRVHTFTPEVFHRTFSGAASPALRINAGDTVRTWILDNAGFDAAGVSRSPAGNPLTGPFYIEGALPGDTIAIRMIRVRLNRNYGQSGIEIIESVLGGDELRRLTEVPGFSGRWRFDLGRGVAMLEQPSPALQGFTAPLRPMVGSIGVAPAGSQAILATESGPFGGNMDYNEIREGVTIYLPVFQRGAMLFIGDGHAVQGDGELTGDAVETSMDVEFSVNVIPAKSTRQPRLAHPRAENEEFLMAIGISGDLSGALRLATSDLVRWLEADYELNASELASVLGTRVRYDIADLVGSQVSVVAKIPKESLKHLTPRRGMAQ